LGYDDERNTMIYTDDQWAVKMAEARAELALHDAGGPCAVPCWACEDEAREDAPLPDGLSV
jgi:hypothetical protein